jgi:hypothetical protein
MGWINGSQFERDHAGLRNQCSACGHEGSPLNPLVLSDDGYRVHSSHTADPTSGLYNADQRRTERTSMLTDTKLSPAQWRVLNWIRDCNILTTRPCRVSDAVNKQHATAEDLIYLEERGLVEVFFGISDKISFADLVRDAKSLVTVFTQTTLRLTVGGVRRVLDDPTNLVIRTLTWEQRGRRVEYVKHEAQANDATIFEMEESGLIETTDPKVRLADFRTLKGLPGEGKIRLTRKGRTYCTQGTPPR